MDFQGILLVTVCIVVFGTQGHSSSVNQDFDDLLYEGHSQYIPENFLALPDGRTSFIDGNTIDEEFYISGHKSSATSPRAATELTRHQGPSANVASPKTRQDYVKLVEPSTNSIKASQRAEMVNVTLSTGGGQELLTERKHSAGLKTVTTPPTKVHVCYCTREHVSNTRDKGHTKSEEKRRHADKEHFRGVMLAGEPVDIIVWFKNSNETDKGTLPGTAMEPKEETDVGSEALTIT